jgi:hypothetical protein
MFTQSHAWHITQSGSGTALFCHVLCLRLHGNVMLRFMVQALQDPPLCSSIICWTVHSKIKIYFICYIFFRTKKYNSEIFPSIQI